MKNPNALAELLEAEAKYLVANSWVKVSKHGEIVWGHHTIDGYRRQKNAVIYQRYLDLNGHKVKQ